VVNRNYEVVDLNGAAIALVGTVLGGSDRIGRNLARLTFDPNGAQPFVANFDVVGLQLLWRIQREGHWCTVR